MCVCGVTIVILMMTKIITASSFFDPFDILSGNSHSHGIYSNLGTLPVFGSHNVAGLGFLGGSTGRPYFWQDIWKDYEDVDDFTHYNYEEFGTDEETTEGIDEEEEDKKYDDTYYEYYETETEQYSVTEQIQSNYTEILQYDDAETQQYNDTDTWQYNDNETQQYRYTETQRNYDTGTEHNNDTETQQNYDTEIQHNYDTVTEQKNDTETQLYYDTGTEQNNDTETQQNNNTETQQYYDTGTDQNNDTGIPLTSDTETQQNNDTGTQQNNDTGTRQNNDTEKQQNNDTESTVVGQYNHSEVKLDNHTGKGQRTRSGEKLNSQTKVKRKNRIRPKPPKPYPVPDYKFIHTIRNETKCPNDTICARKCCPTGWGYHVSTDTCIRTQDTFNPPLWEGYTLMEGIRATEKLHFLDGFITCVPKEDEVRKPVTDVSKVFRLKTDGEFYVENPMAISPELIFKKNKYCMDVFITAEKETQLNALICYIEKNDVKRQYTLSAICMLVTCFLVLLRVVLFAWLPELRTLHGMILMAYLISFLVGFLLLGSQLLLGLTQIISQNVCVGITFIVYFTILSAFFWRNVMCYDIWWTFSGKRAISGRGSSSRARFYLYCGYAFGGPTALTILLAGLEFSQPPSALVHPLMPKVRIHGCFLVGYSKLLYFMGPIIILFVINMVCFTLTALKIAAIKKETKKVFESKESCTHAQKKDTRQFALYIRLFTAMAFLEVNWILEVITILYPDAGILLHFSDIYNVLVPLIIFVNFLCQKKTWKMINKRYRQIRRLPISEGQTTGISSRTHNSQSQDDIEAQITQPEAIGEPC